VKKRGLYERLDKMDNIAITKSTTLKEKYKDPSELVFGRRFTDHMLQMDFDPENGWHDMRIEPYAPVPMDPASSVLHYGQAIFEGMKAYKSPEGEILLFRPEENFMRLNSSAKRLSIPEIDVEQALFGLNELLKIEKDWIPAARGTSLYIRPFIVATDPFIGLRASQLYKFMIILSPVGMYYAEGFNPIKIFVEDEYVRAVRGGTGFTKAAGNYAGSLYAEVIAKKKGYAQVLWLDALENRYCEEVGSMNIFFVIGDELITPMLSGSILPGITRKSVIQLAQDLGYRVSERMIGIDEVYEAHAGGQLKEIFGTGTAAVISPVGLLDWDGRVITVNDMKTGPVTKLLYDKLTGIQYGDLPDKFGWVVKVQ